MKTDYYVYVFFRPWDGSPCYVGKGRRFRWLEHERLGVNHYNTHFANLLRKAGGEMPKVKIREGLTSAEAAAVEVALIAAIGRQQNGGPLVNLTDGGDGSNGWHHSSDAKARIAAAASSRVVTEATRDKLRQNQLGKTGLKHSEAFKEKIRTIHTGRTKSPEECAAISRGKIGHKVSAATRAKIGAALAGRKNGPLTETHRAKISAARLAS